MACQEAMCTDGVMGSEDIVGVCDALARGRRICQITWLFGRRYLRIGVFSS